MLVSTTFTIGGNRGIYLGPGGGDMGENTINGQVTIAGAISGPGNLLFETDGTGSSFKLTGANTYAGQTTVQSSTGLVIGSGGATGTFGTGNIVNNGTVTVNRSGTLNYAGGISGTGGLALTSAAAAVITFSGPLSESGTLSLAGAGAIVFAGSNTYSANTVIGCQYFMADNTNGSATGTGAVTVGVTGGGSYLGGTGSLSGPVSVVAENTLQPGNPLTGSPGILVISNSLTLQAGSMSVLNLNAAAPPGSAVVGMTSVTYGGTLTVNVASGTPAAGQTYQLFQAGSYSGSFEGGVQLPSLPSGLNWNTNNLSVNGSISVTGQNGVFNPPVFSGNQLILSGTSGLANGTYTVLVSTNLAQPSAWTILSSGNTFDSNGNFSFTNTVNPAVTQQYFRISQP
jgi:fibronectin-binding autotransporter adhesin